MKSQNPWILVTGGAGFIGSSFIRSALARYNIVVLDALTYAGRIENLEEVLREGQCEFVKGDIKDFSLVESLLKKYQIQAVVHFAAESHVDNSISGPRVFMETNIMGTFTLLEASRKYYNEFKNSNFRFVHVSTDEVFGALGETGYFSESTAYAPNSPYSSSKAASDMLARAWFHTYGLPVIITNCSNNYGPRQFPEKLIPRMITNALSGKKLPVYGEGKNIRDWIHVEDHSQGVLLALMKGRLGESYCFGGRSERRNIDLVKNLCHELDRVKPLASGKKYEESIEFVKDRLGHDYRYAIDDSKAEKELGFVRKYKNFEEGLKQTISWYLENQRWVEAILNSNLESQGEKK